MIPLLFQVETAAERLNDLGEVSQVPPAGAATGGQSVQLKAEAPNPTLQRPLQFLLHSLRPLLQVGSNSPLSR